jgi:DNA invertase Pin-like site-specific DNA recombinase
MEVIFMNNTKAAIYCRVASADEFAIKSQEEMLLNYAMEHQLDVGDVYSDNGASGVTLDRPAFQKMMSGIKKCEIDCVIVKSIDRISRNRSQFGAWLHNMCKKGIRVISINDGYDSANSHDTLNEWFAEIERLYKEELSKRIKMGIAYSRQRKLEQAKLEQAATTTM